MDWKAEEKTHWSGVDGEDGWTASSTDFLPPSPKFSHSTMLDLSEMFTQLWLTLSNPNTNKGCGANR